MKRVLVYGNRKTSDIAFDASTIIDIVVLLGNYSEKTTLNMK